ncbi:hypothetical protein D9M71_749030 [compost metagenome]
MALAGGVAAVQLVDVQVARTELAVAFGELLQHGLEPVTVVEGARLDQAQVASAQGAHRER